MELIICILPYFFMLFSYIILSLTSYVSKSKVFFYLAILVVMLFVGFKDIILPGFQTLCYSIRKYWKYWRSL